MKEAELMQDMFKGCDKLKMENVKNKDSKIKNQLILDLKK
jgi:hypothetical protein